MLPRIAALVLSMSLLVGSGCVSPALREAPWVVVTSPRFEILSTISEEETKSLASELERFHALIYAVTSAQESEPPIPTKIYAFKSKSQYRRFGSRQSSGFFGAGMRENLIVLLDESNRLGASEVILHEYVHFVVRNGQLVQYPVWYDEGFAEFLSTARTHGDLVAIGAIPEARIPSFQYGTWVALSRIISATAYSDLPAGDRHMLYAQGWALVHYLSLDRTGRSMSADLSRYMELLQLGLDHESAYERAFGEPIGTTAMTVQRILEKGGMRVIGIPIEKLEFDRTPPTARVPGKVEVAIRLGALSLAVDDPESAEDEFRAALALDPENARAHAGLGDALKFQQRWEAAEPRFRRAVELAGEDALNQLDLAEFLHDRALEARSRDALVRDLEAARAVYQRALELDDGLPETWAMLGRTHLAPGEDAAKGRELVERAFRMLPSSPQILLLLAEAHVASEDDASARQLLARFLASRADGGLESTVDEQIAEIRKRRAELAEKTAGSRASGATDRAIR